MAWRRRFAPDAQLNRLRLSRSEHLAVWILIHYSYRYLCYP